MGLSGRSARKKAKREAAWQAEQNALQQQAFEAERERERIRQDNLRQAASNVRQAQQSLDQTSVFGMVEDGLGIEGVGGESTVAGEVAGTRKRRKKQDTGGGLGIM